jgi:hypothetical protein
MMQNYKSFNLVKLNRFLLNSFKRPQQQQQQKLNILSSSPPFSEHLDQYLIKSNQNFDGILKKAFNLFQSNPKQQQNNSSSSSPPPFNQSSQQKNNPNNKLFAYIAIGSFILSLYFTEKAVKQAEIERLKQEVDELNNNNKTLPESQQQQQQQIRLPNTKEISWSQFTGLVKGRQIDTISIFKKNDKERVCIVQTKDNNNNNNNNSSPKIPKRFILQITDTFEDKLRQIEDEMGLKQEERANIKYPNVDTLNKVMNLTLLGLLLYVLYSCKPTNY